jgi:hypothetical protein
MLANELTQLARGFVLAEGNGGVTQGKAAVMGQGEPRPEPQESTEAKEEGEGQSPQEARARTIEDVEAKIAHQEIRNGLVNRRPA